MLRRIITLFFCLALLVVGLFIWAYLAPSVTAAGPVEQLQAGTPQPGAPAPTPEPTRIPNMSLSDQYCLDCHGKPGQTYTLPSGEVLDITVTQDMYDNSIHGKKHYACVQCHTDVGEYPHTKILPNDRRGVTLLLNRACARCHSMQFELAEDDVHANAQRAGIREAAVCADCHTAHEVRQLTDPKTHQLLPETRQWIPTRCALCHNAIYQKYEASVHGSALTEGNPDVPTCIDCHGVHNIENPTTAYFRLRSPDICAKCHTDPQRMGKYNISTNVLNTYVADFHGTTVAIFEKTSPDAEVNKAVCYDCHGIHDIQRANDPNSNMKTNLLARCQTCHPDANQNFPAAWLSHYTPSPSHYALVFWVNEFYKFFIPGVLGGMGVLVVMDAGRTLYRRRRKGRTGAEVFTAPDKLVPAPEAVQSDLPANIRDDRPGGEEDHG